MKHDSWVPACGGTELPFTTRSGKVLQYMWNRTTGDHAYYCVTDDLFLSDDDARLYLSV